MQTLKPADKKSSFDQKLKSYAAMGAAFLAAAPSAEATIVYHDPPDIVLSVSPSNGFISASLFLDIDGNTTASVNFSGADVRFTMAGGNYSGTTFGTLWAEARGFNNADVFRSAQSGYWAYGTSYAATMPARLPGGFTIGTNLSFPGGRDDLAGSWGLYGSFRDSWGAWSPAPQGGYLGVRFDIGANTHYGWVQVCIDMNWYDPTCMTLTILDYAYEDVPNAPIITPPTTNCAPPTCSTPTPPTAAVPTMSEWGLINLGLLLLTMGTLFIRRIRETLGLQVEEVKES